MKNDLLMRFILGGGAVMVSYLIIVISPWAILGGIFAAFPAVMITAVLMAGITKGTKNAANIANGSIYGMIGGVICAATVWVVLNVSHIWTLSMILGLLVWLGSSLMISSFRDRFNGVRIRRGRIITIYESWLRHDK